MPFRQRQHISTSKLQTLIAAFLITGVSLGFVTNAVTAQTDAGTESIAHGVSAIPGDDAGQSAWRVVLDTVQPMSETQPIERALGFVMALDEPLLIGHADSGTTDLVPADGASFVNEGDFEQRSSIDGDPTSYYRIALVLPSEAADPANGEIVLSSDAFATPDGSRAINLQSVTIAPGSSTSLAGGTAPSLVIATSGSVTLNDGATLSQGQATTIDGDVSLTAGESTAVVAVATIGEEVSLTGDSGNVEESEAAPAATPVVDETGAEPTSELESNVSILVEAIDCSNGDPVTWENCTPLEGVLFSLIRAEETSSSETGISTDANGQVYDMSGDGSTVTVAYADGAPEGLVPLTGPFTVENVQEGQVFVFVFGTPDQLEQ